MIIWIITRHSGSVSCRMKRYKEVYIINVESTSTSPSSWPRWGVVEPDADRKKKRKKERQKERQLWNDRNTQDCPSIQRSLCPSVCLHQPLSPSPSTSSGVVEDGVQLGIHQPFMVRVSIKAHQPVHLQLTAPWVGPPTAIDGSMSPRSSSPVVHTEGETLVVVGSCDSLLLEGWEVSVDAQRRAQRRVERGAVRHQDAVKEGLQRAIGLTFDLVEDVGGLHGTIGWAGQAGRQPGALVGEVSWIGDSAGGGKMSRKVGCLFRQESPRIQLQAARH